MIYEEEKENGLCARKPFENLINKSEINKTRSQIYAHLSLRVCSPEGKVCVYSDLFTIKISFIIVHHLKGVCPWGVS